MEGNENATESVEPQEVNYATKWRGLTKSEKAAMKDAGYSRKSWNTNYRTQRRTTARATEGTAAWAKDQSRLIRTQSQQAAADIKTTAASSAESYVNTGGVITKSGKPVDTPLTGTQKLGLASIQAGGGGGGGGMMPLLLVGGGLAALYFISKG